MGKPVTARQLEVLRAIASESPPPTIRELAAKLGITSNNGVKDHLIALRARGLVEWTPFKSRNLRLTVDGQRVLGLTRLSDERIKEDRRAVRRYVPQHRAPQEALERLETDHDRARAEVRRLAKLLRAGATEGPDGALCWCGDGEVNSYCWSNPHGRSLFCIECSAILSEVGGGP